MNLSLRTAIIFATLLGLLLPSGVNGYISLTRQLDNAQRQIGLDHQRIADILVLGMQEPLWNLSPDAGKPLLESVISDERIVRITVNDSTLGLFIEANKPERRRGRLHSLTRVVSKQGSNIGTITIELDDGDATLRIRSEQKLYLAAVLLQIVLSLGLILLLLESRIIRPLAELSRQAIQLARHELDEAFVWQRSDEIGTLGHNLETTRKSLSDLILTLEQKNLQLETDILGRRQIELALRTSQDRYRRLVESTHIIPWDANPDEWRLTYVGPQAEALLGYPLAQWYQEGFLSSYLHPDDRHHAYRLFSETGKTGTSEFECRFLSSTGEEKWVLLTASAQCDAENKRTLQGFIIDISERKQAELDIERYRNHLEEVVEARTRALASANHELEAFSYSVSHDLRIPLRTIEGFTQVLLEDYIGSLDANARNYLTRIRSTTHNMTSLIDDLLNLSKLTRIEVRCQSINLSALSEEIIDEFRSLQPQRQIDICIEENLKANADPKLMLIALRHLLDNAWKFTEQTQEAKISISANEIGGQTVFCIQDNGIGFDMTHANKIFSPFQRLHSHAELTGNGIGLAIVQRIIHRHNGRIWAKSQPDSHTTFYFTLPNKPQAKHHIPH
ncbi:sensor histidine kinase [Iodobacter ciconiae]|uniref:histidine kinase n=1 Tax=Iodobacter ciconiae TaxID=2496266 RepID=A0A3S8ZS83_9NEIS|nr:ATP-binding protein [Iodobacter ciconiae]AZN36370.1 PAS domain S-box protein [Iodobacter ciconiae]